MNYTFFGIDVFVTLESVKTKINIMSLFQIWQILDASEKTEKLETVIYDKFTYNSDELHIFWYWCICSTWVGQNKD